MDSFFLEIEMLENFDFSFYVEQRQIKACYDADS